jgi:hypothetical protein
MPTGVVVVLDAAGVKASMKEPEANSKPMIASAVSLSHNDARVPTFLGLNPDYTVDPLELENYLRLPWQDHQHLTSTSEHKSLRPKCGYCGVVNQIQ